MYFNLIIKGAALVVTSLNVYTITADQNQLKPEIFLSVTMKIKHVTKNVLIYFVEHYLDHKQHSYRHHSKLLIIFLGFKSF